MASTNCLACGAKLTLTGNKDAKCQNPNCPGGGKYVKCGFCKEYSFATRYSQQMACVNRRCRMHNRVRQICSACKKASFIDYNGRPVCINRNCPSNSHVIDTCFFCKNKSFLNDDALMLCTKGDCPYLLYEVRECGFCKQRSFLVHAQSCQNQECQYYNVIVEKCESCGQATVVPDSASPGGRKCMNPQCARLAAVDMAEMTLDSIDVSELRQMAEAQPQPPRAAPAPKPAIPAPAPAPAPAQAQMPQPAGYEEQQTPSPPPGYEPEAQEPAPEAAEAATADEPAAAPEDEDLASRPRDKGKDRQTVVYMRSADQGGAKEPTEALGEDDIVIEDAPRAAAPSAQIEQAPGEDIISDDGQQEEFTPAAEAEAEEVFSFQGASSPGSGDTRSRGASRDSARIRNQPASQPAPQPAKPAPAQQPAAAAPKPAPAQQPAAAAPKPAPAPADEDDSSEPAEPAEPAAPAGRAPAAAAAAPAARAPSPPMNLVEDEDDEVIIEGGAKPAARPGTETRPAAHAAAAPQAPAPQSSPQQAQPPAGYQSPFDKSTPLTRVFRFLSEYVLKDERGVHYPLFLIIGLAGSGKTNYLTMLGDILNKREINYFFPYEGIDIKPVRVDRIIKQNPDKFRAQFGANFDHEIQTQIQDLVYTYSSRQFSEFIANTVWPPFTPPEEGSTYFLLTEITRNQKTIAKIATLETSGETFEEIIRGMSGGKLDLATDSPLQRVVHELLDMAEGYVILIDPAKKDNEDIYEHLFLALKQGVEPRAMNLFYSKVREKILEKKGKKPGGIMEMIEGYMEAEKDKQKLSEAIKARGLKLQEELAPLAEQLSSPDTDIKDFYSRHSDELGRLQEVVKERFPEVYERVIKKMQEKEEKEGPSPDIYRDFLLSMVKFALDMKNLKELAKFLYAADVRKAESQALASLESNEEKMETARLVMEAAGIRMNAEIDPELPDNREVMRFKNLKHIALAVTKSDMYPIIYPPEEYPKKKLQRCDRRLKELNEFLKILGGGTRYYNTSATGYSVLKDTMYMPGHKNTLTPINVIEPIFDMLNI